MYGTLCTEFYDIDKQFAEADEINFYQKFLAENSLILEPMCGSGRLLIPLMQAGYQIHGVDNSVPMLESCRKRASALGLSPTLFQDSIETMTLPNQYQTILIPLGSFQLLYPRSVAFDALQNFKKHLQLGGKLILDLFVPWEALDDNKQDEINEKSVTSSEGYIIHITSHNRANKFEQYCYSESKYQKRLDGDLTSEENEEMHLSWYYRYEMELILEKCGFKNIVYQEEFFRNETHMIFIAEK